eukprot:scaffold47033_cov18-Tisochrysis_lutea.AAC.6
MLRNIGRVARNNARSVGRHLLRRPLVRTASQTCLLFTQAAGKDSKPKLEHGAKEDELHVYSCLRARSGRSVTYRTVYHRKQ